MNRARCWLLVRLPSFYAFASNARVPVQTAQRYRPHLPARGLSTLPPHTVLGMPALSPTMNQGNIAKWHVKEGDELQAGQVLADIETDKATLALENQDEGYMAKILVPEGTKDVAVGTPIALVVDSADLVAGFASATSAAAQSASAAPSHTPTTSPAANSNAVLPPFTGLQMPALSPTMERGNIVKWSVKEGDEVVPGTVLAEIETDKATLAFENQDEGYIARILVPEGSKDVAVGDVVAIIVENKDDVPKFANYSVPAPQSSGAAAVTPAPATTATAAPSTPSVPQNSRIFPAVRYYLAQYGLSLSDVKATGPHNIVTKGDVLAAVAAGVKPRTAAAQPAHQAAAAPAAAPAAPAAAPRAVQTAPAGPSTGAYTDTPVTQIRKIIAERLVGSKRTTPSLYVSADADLDGVAAIRKQLAAQGTKVSVNDFVVKAVALALKDVPEANAFWDETASTSSLQPDVDISIAVATDKGLITPIVRKADQKSLLQLSKEVKELAAKARENKLKPEEFQGGTFSISNLGMFGVTSFSAIINPPQAGILAIGGTQQTVVLVDGEPQEKSFMTVMLSADHRVYGPELAAEFLQAFTNYIQNPVKLLL